MFGSIYFDVWFGVSLTVCSIAWFFMVERQRDEIRSASFARRTKNTLTTNALDAASKNQRKPNWVHDEVLRLAALMQSHHSCRKVMVCFNRLHGNRYGVTVGKSFVAELVKKHRLQILQLRREFKTKPPRTVAVNHTWAMDLTFHTDAENRTHANLGMVDHGSRVLLCLRTLTSRNSWTLLGHLCLAIGKYGKPRKLRTENKRSACYVIAITKSFLTRLCLKRFSNLLAFRSKPQTYTVRGRTAELSGCLVRSNLCCVS